METCIHPVARRSDPQLVDAARCGDREAFGELIRRHHQRCVNLAASVLRDRGEAEEETQNACWKAFKHLDQFHGDAEFSSWLFRIVKNQCLMLIRRRHGVQFVHLDHRNSEEGKNPIQLPSTGADPEGDLGSREVSEILKTEIRRMPPLLRTVIMLRDVNQLPMPDIAEQLNITVEAAKSRLLRARNELRLRMMRHCGRTGAWSLMTEAAAPPERVFHQNAQSAA